MSIRAPIIDITGTRWGRLAVVSYVGYGQYLCRCDCGVEKRAGGAALRSGMTTSCGCYAKEATSNRSKTHGLSKTRMYQLWAGMKARCYRKTSPDYPQWGGRGISVCPQWRDSFEQFLADMGDRPKGATLDRIDNDGNYEPGNCRWASRKEQNRNRRDNLQLTMNGETRCVNEWAEHLGIDASTFRARIRRGWSIEKAAKVPIATQERIIEVGGEARSVTAWANHLGIPRETIYSRLRRGVTPEKALSC